MAPIATGGFVSGWCRRVRAALAPALDLLREPLEDIPPAPPSLTPEMLREQRSLLR
jgi:hypothetical protein